MADNVEENSQVGNDYKKYSYFIILFTAVYLLVAYIMIFLVDFINIFGSSSWMVKNGYVPPLLWFHLFKEASITECLQWLFLGLSLILAIYCRNLKAIINGSHSTSLWYFLYLGLLLMIVEDVLNFRFWLLGVAARSVQIEYYSFARSIWGSLIEFCFYFIIGFCMLAFLALIVKKNKENLFGIKLLLLGYFFYGIASVGSATRHVNNWYNIAGIELLNFSTRFFSLDWSGDTIVYEYQVSGHTLGYWFIDNVIEESFELLGATFILASITAFITYTKAKNYDLSQ